MERNRLSSSRFFVEFNHDTGLDGDTGLSDLCMQLLARQKEIWPELRSGGEAVARSLFRTIDCGDFSVTLQFNPRRIVSSGARVDPASILARPCFLCPDNLPDAQQGILYHRDFLLLCNPFPIFPQHFTISSLDHRPQFLEGHLEILFLLARDLAPSLAVFYNGPQCGASAPDHLHFQTCPAGSLPVEAQLDDGRPVLPVTKHGSASVFQVERLGRTALMIEGSDADSLKGAIKKLLAVMKTGIASETEPMLNLHAAFKEGKWRIFLFPRGKTRPDLYYREESERILISPGSVEMGGLLVVPVERDFLRLTPELVCHIYREVSVNPDLPEKWTRRLSLMAD